VTFFNAGSKAAWTGPEIKREYNKAMVRVRVWKTSDFPIPAFSSNWTYVSTEQGRLYPHIPKPILYQSFRVYFLAHLCNFSTFRLSADRRPLTFITILTP